MNSIRALQRNVWRTNLGKVTFNMPIFLSEKNRLIPPQTFFLFNQHPVKKVIFLSSSWNPETAQQATKHLTEGHRCCLCRTCLWWPCSRKATVSTMEWFGDDLAIIKSSRAKSVYTWVIHHGRVTLHYLRSRSLDWCGMPFCVGVAFFE